MKKNADETTTAITSKLDQKELKLLDEKLSEKLKEIDTEAITKFKKTLKPKRTITAEEYKELSDEEAIEELNKIREDIKDTYSSGVSVKLADLFQTYALIPFFKIQKVDIPPKINILYENNGYDFYVIEVNFRTSLDGKLYLKRTDLKLTIKDDITKNERKSRFLKIFPDNEYQNYFTANFKGNVGVDANLNFKFDADDILKGLNLKIASELALNTKLDLDLGTMTFRKAKIENSGESDVSADWKYNVSSSEYKNDDYVSRAILQIPKEAQDVKIKAELEVTPYKKIWFWFDEALTPIRVEPVELSIELVPRKKK